MDGATLGVADAESFEVVMADRTRWEYVATDDRELLPGASEAVVYVCRGRR
jgi:hypothetical protein